MHTTNFGVMVFTKLLVLLVIPIFTMGLQMNIKQLAKFKHSPVGLDHNILNYSLLYFYGILVVCFV